MRWWHELVGLVYPPRCLLCGSTPQAEESFCPRCAKLFDDPHTTCPRCAARLGRHATCIVCTAQSFGFDAAMRLGPYYPDKKQGGPLRDAVLRCKHAAYEGLAELLGEQWAARHRDRFLALKADAIVPVPLHWWRRLSRGYNQAAAIAYGLGVALGVPCRYRWLRRARYTAKQVAVMRPAERRENVRGAFAPRRGVRLTGLHILLVDDVMTTGATASEAALALKRAGAARVSVAVLARADG